MSKHNRTFIHGDIECIHSLNCIDKEENTKKQKKRKIRSCTHTQLALLTKEREHDREKEVLKESPLRDVMDKASSLFINRQNNR